MPQDGTAEALAVRAAIAGSPWVRCRRRLYGEESGRGDFR